MSAPKWAGIAGLTYGLIMIVVLGLRQFGIPAETAGGGLVLTPDGLQAVTIATALVPFAGIAFLWFIGVVRSELADKEDKFFGTVLLGSGLLYVAMMFMSAATTGTLLLLINSGYSQSDHTVGALHALTTTITASFGARMAAVFVVSVTTTGRRAGIIRSKPIILIGYAVAVALLLTPPLPRWLQLLFPFWVMMLGLMVLIRDRRKSAST